MELHVLCVVTELNNLILFSYTVLITLTRGTQKKEEKIKTNTCMSIYTGFTSLQQ